MGGDETHEHRTESATGGHHQVKECQALPGLGFSPGKFAVAEHAAHKQRRRKQKDFPVQAADHALAGQPKTHGEPGSRQDPAIHPRTVPALPVEAQDEAQQIQAERENPQERNRRYFLTQVIGNGKPERRGARRQYDPLKWLRNGTGAALLLSGRFFRRATQRGDGREQNESEEYS